MDDFVTYAEVCFEAFGDRVKYWQTFNEPLSVTLGCYLDGTMAPGRCSNRYALCVWLRVRSCVLVYVHVCFFVYMCICVCCVCVVWVNVVCGCWCVGVYMCVRVCGVSVCACACVSVCACVE